MISDEDIIRTVCNMEDLDDIPVSVVARVTRATLDCISPNGLIIALDEVDLNGGLL